MGIFLKIVIAILLTVVLCVVLAKQGREISLLLSVAVCCMVGIAAFAFLNPVIEFANKLLTMANLNSELYGILLKCVGIGLLTQITVLICNDAGHAALGKMLQITSSITILRLSIPLLQKLIDILESILGNL